MFATPSLSPLNMRESIKQKAAKVNTETCFLIYGKICWAKRQKINPSILILSVLDNKCRQGNQGNRSVVFDNIMGKQQIIVSYVWRVGASQLEKGVSNPNPCWVDPGHEIRR
jgi:hypothetical protein